MKNIWSQTDTPKSDAKIGKKFRILKNKKLVVILSIIGVLFFFGIVYGIVKSTQNNYEYTTVKVMKGDLIQTVDATGSVKPATEVDLNFKIIGKLAKNNIKVGEEVKEGQVLAELDSKDSLLEVEKARSALALAYANLNLKITGESQESIQVYEEDVAKAQSNLNKVKTDLENTINSNQESVKEAELNVAKYETALITAQQDLENIKLSDTQNIQNSYDDAMITLSSNIISVSTAMTDMDNILGIENESVNDDFESLLGILNAQTKIDADTSYRSASTKQEIVESLVNNLSISSSYQDITTAISEMKDLLTKASDALSKTRIMLDNSIAGTNFSSTTLDGYKTTINTDRATINTAFTTLQTKEQAILTAELNADSNLDAYVSAVNTARNNLDSVEQTLDKAKVNASNALKAAEAQVDIMETALSSAQAVLNFKKAPPRDVDLASLRAQMREARASLDLAEEKLENTKLKAPVVGVVSAVNYEAGEQINLNNPAVSLVGSEGDFKIEVDISESDIPKVKIDNQVEITFDAFGQDKVFVGKVISIDPAETIIQDVVYYQVDISINDGNQEIKPGMTANVEILTASRNNVLYVSQRSVVRRNGEKIVRILEGAKVKEAPVQIGLRANDGLIEIISGIEEGENAITYIKEKK